MSLRTLFARIGAPRSRLTRSIGLMAAGTAAGQALVLLLTPVLTRIYAPSDFGLLGVFTALVSILSVVGTLRYELAIPLPRDERTALHLVLLSFLANAMITLLLAAVVVVAHEPMARLLGAPELSEVLWLLPLTLFATGSYQVVSLWAIRMHQYTQLAARNLLRSAGSVASQAALGLLGAGPAGLLCGTAAGHGVASLGLVTRIWRLSGEERQRVSRRELRAVARRYRRFPLVSSWSGLINSAGVAVPLLMLGKLYGPAVAGAFVLTSRVAVAPVALIGDAVAQVYQGEAATFTRDSVRDCKRLYVSTARLLAWMGTPVLVLMAAVSPWAFPIVFGDQWGQAGVFTVCLLPMYAAQFVVVPLSQTLNLLERQGLQLGWDVARLLAALLALAGPWSLGASPAVAVAAYGSAMAVAYGVLFVASLVTMNRMEAACA